MMESNSPRSSHIPLHCGHQLMVMDDLPKTTETSLTVRHLTHGRSVASTLAFSTASISSLSQRSDPLSTRFLSCRSSSLNSQMPRQFGQDSNGIEPIR